MAESLVARATTRTARSSDDARLASIYAEANAYAAKRGEWVPCSTCGGHGVVAAYSASDFEGPDDCRRCSNGSVWRYPSGVLSIYPGGPFVGKERGLPAEGNQTERTS